MSALKLYEIANQYRELEALADSGDLPPEVIRDTLEALGGDLEMKATNVAKFVRNLEANADLIDEAAKAMQVRANRLRKRADGIKAYLLFNMQATGITKIEAPEFTISLRNNPEAVEIAEGAQIPAEFMVTPEPPPPRPDKAKIKAALKAGGHVDGCNLVAGQRVEIRT